MRFLPLCIIKKECIVIVVSVGWRVLFSVSVKRDKRNKLKKEVFVRGYRVYYCCLVLAFAKPVPQR